MQYYITVTLPETMNIFVNILAERLLACIKIKPSLMAQCMKIVTDY
jgi:uncharacterized protein involved in tolerance to divalent cations